MNPCFAEMVQNLGRTIGLEDLTPDENGYLCLTFDERPVNIEERDGTVFLYASIGPLPASGREDLYRRLLAANCFFRETQGATLGVDERLGVLLFHQIPLVALDGNRFETVLQNFVNTAEAWRARLEGAQGAQGEAAPAVSAGAVWA